MLVTVIVMAVVMPVLIDLIVIVPGTLWQVKTLKVKSKNMTETVITPLIADDTNNSNDNIKY